MWDELPVAALDFSSLLVCVVFLPQGGGFVGIRIDRTIVPPIVHFFGGFVGIRIDLYFDA